MVFIGLLAIHYLLVRILGIAKPYRKDIVRKTVPANHQLLFIRGGMLIVLVLILAAVLPSPYIKPVSIQSVATQDPHLIGKTLVAEFDRSSDTATYLDNIDPYTFDTRNVYITAPYEAYLLTQTNKTDQLKIFLDEPQSTQTAQLQLATKYFDQGTTQGNKSVNPAIATVNSLITMAQSGLYEANLAQTNSGGQHADSSTYTTRFLADTGVMEDKASSLNITTDQYGMVREETGKTPGAWWLTPIGLLNHTILANDDNGDRDGAILFGSFFLTLLAFPFIPYVNQIPDKLKVYKIIWRQKK